VTHEKAMALELERSRLASVARRLSTQLFEMKEADPNHHEPHSEEPHHHHTARLDLMDDLYHSNIVAPNQGELKPSTVRRGNTVHPATSMAPQHRVPKSTSLRHISPRGNKPLRSLSKSASERCVPGNSATPTRRKRPSSPVHFPVAALGQHRVDLRLYGERAVAEVGAGWFQRPGIILEDEETLDDIFQRGVLYQDWKGLKWWNIFITLLILYSVVTIPFSIGFGTKSTFDSIYQRHIVLTGV
jgi:hypothetical protein